MKPNQLLSDLKACSEMGVVFEKGLRFNPYSTTKLHKDGRFRFSILSQETWLLPTVEWVEGKIVGLDKLKDKDFSLAIEFYEFTGKWNYSLMTNIQKPDDAPKEYVETQHKLRLNASVSLLRKLKESKEK